MLIAVIPITDYEEAKIQLNKAHKQADAIELRLDYLSHLDFIAIADLRFTCKIPVIFTLRKTSQGGYYQKSEEQRLKDISQLCQYEPDYFDIEYDVSLDFLKDITERYPTIKWLRSFHDFNETPSDLNTLFDTLKHSYFYAYKIVTHANTILDALRMLEFVKSAHIKYKITGLCMGEKGQITRILSPIIGNTMNYAILNLTHSTAPGQLTLNELLTIYHYRKLNSQTKIYALLGDPVSLSVGHILHNQAIEYLNENAVYLKILVTADELPTLIETCKRLPFFGFSITMPLKEKVLPQLDKVEDPSIKAINSITKLQGTYIGFNTDGVGAIQVLLSYTDVFQKTIMILGAGGAARAIAYEALRQKARVVILNRTLDKAKTLANELGCESGELKNLSRLTKPYDSIIINTLPHHIYDESLTPKTGTVSLLEWINPNTLQNRIVMDIVYQPIETTFLKIAKEVNCTCIFGYKMYIQQALLQIKRWFKPTEQQLQDIENQWNNFFWIEQQSLL